MEVRDAESKRAVLSELLEQGMVLVTLDARLHEVDVPPHLRDDAQLRLNLSYRFGLPVTLDDEGVCATLTFSGSAYPCRLPWRSLYLFVSHVTGRPILFPADVPTEFSLNGFGATRPSVTPIAWGSGPQTARGRPRLRVISGAATEAEADADAAPAAEEGEPKNPPPRRGHLRVIK